MRSTDYNMAFSISALVSSSTHISPRLSPWADMGVSGRYGKGHVIIYIYCYVHTVTRIVKLLTVVHWFRCYYQVHL